MSRRGKRRNLGRPGMWADDGGYAATVKVGDQPQREQRFTPSDDLEADLRAMERWQLHTRATLLGTQPAQARRDTLASAVPRFLATMPEGSSARHDHEKLLAAWVATSLGSMRRSDIRRSQVATQLAAWEVEGYAPGTLNHRLRSLRKLFDVLDSDDDEAINPCAKIPKYTEPEMEERGAEYVILEGILACIPDIGYSKRGEPRPPFNKSKIRLRVMAWTGLPPALVKRIRAPHVLWDEKELDVTPRRKGKGVKARRLPLLDEALEAFRDMQAAGAFGSYSNAGPWNAWQRGKRRYLKALADAGATPAALAEVTRIVTPLRPYDLRHSFAAMVYETTGNQSAVKDLLMHGSLQTSERYIKRAVIKVSRNAIASVQASRIAQFGPRLVVPAGASAPSRNIAKSRVKRAILPSAGHSGKQAKSRVSSKKRAV